MNIVKITKKITGSLWNYYRDEPNSDTDDREINYSIINSKSFHYKANFMENGVTQNNFIKNDNKIVVPLKYLSNFWRILNTPLVNCEVELILTWFKRCVLISKLTRDADYDEPIDRKFDILENAIFQITDTKLYVPVISSSKENDIKLLEQLKSGSFIRTIKWNKYRSQMTFSFKITN